ncbi:DUF4870 domain-containing protein [Texcoconibacillus texcoconensis]|nr:DUF4870 domain-containing protein [Texcoconibacillus texcoconensis]
MLIYLLSFFTTIIGPLIIWLLKKDESELIDHHGREYFNFTISFMVYMVVAIILTMVLVGIFLAFIIPVIGFIITIVGAVKAYHGEYYRLPLIFRIL